MNKFLLYSAFSLFLLVSCGTEKKALDNNAPISKADYPYINAFHEALRYKTNGRIDEAIAKFEYCLSIRQDDDAVYYALSKLELIRGNEDKSAEYIIKAAEIDNDNTWYIQELAYMYYERQDFAKSVESFGRLVEIEPRNVDWLYGYAEALVRNGQEKEAIDALTKTEERVGKHPQFALQRYNLYMSMKQIEKAEQELLNAKKNFPEDASIIANLVDHYYKSGNEEKAIKMLEELVEADPNNGRAHLALADVYQRRGDEEMTFSELRKAFASDDVDIDTKMKILIRLQESSPIIDQKMIGLLDVFVETHADEAKAYSIQGDYRISMNDEVGALESYKKALELDKTLYPIWNQVMIMEYQAGKYEDLYNHSKECLELFPSLSTVYLLNGVSANQLGKYNEALEVLNFGKEIIINDPLMEAEFLGQIGEAHFGLNQFSDAITVYKKAIERDPQSNLLKNNFARRLATVKKDLDLAESLVKQIVKFSPNNELYMDTYGWVLFQKGDFEKAGEWFLKALAINGSDRLIVEHVGDVLSKQGQINDAIDYWKRAKELGSTNQVIDKKIADKKYYDPEY